MGKTVSSIGRFKRIVALLARFRLIEFLLTTVHGFAEDLQTGESLTRSSTANNSTTITIHKMEESGAYASQSVDGYERGEINGSMNQKENRAQYSIQSVLHYIQSEWRRMELQHSQWLMERSELEARIAFLQGERRGQENLKQDLVRRIKMLEHALKQERVRFHQLKTSLNSGHDGEIDENIKPGPDSSGEHVKDPGQQLYKCTEQAVESNTKWRESRQRLKHFLQEIGYTDSILAVRQSRVRQLLCTPGTDLSDNRSEKNRSLSDRDSLNMRDTEEAVLRTFDFLDAVPKSDCDGKISGGEEYNNVDGNADKNTGNAQCGDEGVISSFISELGPNDANSVKRFGRRAGVDNKLVNFLNSLSDKEGEGQFDNQKPDSVYPPSDLISGGGGCGAGIGAQMREGDAVGGLMNFSGASNQSGGGSVTGAGLGDLASLTVANESESGNDADQCEGGYLQGDLLFQQKQSSAVSSTYTPATLSDCRRPWTKKFVLRGHFDCIRSVTFHPAEPFVYTAGEDGLVMLWALNLPNSRAKTGGHGVHGTGLSTSDLDAMHIYRGHNGPVLALSVPGVGQCSSGIFSAGIDGTVRGWRLPSVDPSTGLFDLYAPSQLSTELGPVFKHDDASDKAAIWDISVHPVCPLLTSVDSASAITFWPLDNDVIGETTNGPVLPSRTIFLNDLIAPTAGDASLGRTTCFTYLGNRSDPSNATQCLVGTNTGWLALIDIETGKLISQVSPPPEPMEQDADPLNPNSNQDLHSITFPGSGCGPRGIHALTIHKTLSLVITGHEDKRIRFYDIGRMGGGEPACVDTTVTHLDSVTCLAVDPHDLYLLTGSHDKSIRLWDLESRMCVQEMTSHRSKNNEAVHGVAIHPILPFAASAGADATCKVYYCEQPS